MGLCRKERMVQRTGTKQIKPFQKRKRMLNGRTENTVTVWSCSWVGRRWSRRMQRLGGVLGGVPSAGKQR